MTGDNFEVYPPRRKVALLVLLGVAMTAASVLPLWLAWTGQEEAWVMLPIGLVGVLFFGFATLVGASRLISPRPVLRVDEVGVHVWRYPVLQWDAFLMAEAAVTSGELMLVLHSVDDDAFRARMVWYRRLWARGNAALVPGAVYLSGRLLPVSAEEMAQRINDAAPRR